MTRTTRTVALMRGINVGGNKLVPMADLRATLESLGYTDVRTLLQSGNAVFTCNTTAAKTAAADVSAGIERDIGVRCAVLVRTAAEIQQILATAPLLPVATDGSRHLVGFLESEPTAQAARDIAAIDLPPDLIRLAGREVYLWCPAGISKSRLLEVKWEKMLGVTVTARNWNTVGKIAALMGTD